MPPRTAPDPAIRIREADAGDIPLLAHHRAAMFRDMGRLAEEAEAALVLATAEYLGEALPRGEYLGWVAEAAGSPTRPIGGVGAQLRSLVPRPAAGGIERGPEAIILNMYVEPAWRRRGVGDALLRSVLAALAERRVRRIVLHASEQGRRLYERLGFVPTNEMRLDA